MHIGYVVVEAEAGVFVGVAMGLAFFSAVGDAAGQYQVPTNTEAIVQQVMDRLACEDIPRERLSAVRVETAHPNFATPSELATAGVRDDWLTTLRENERMAQRVNADPAPSAIQPLVRGVGTSVPTPTHAAPRRVQ